MIDKDLYRETFSRLCASDEAKKEVFHMMEKQKKIRIPKLLRGAAIAAVMTMALAVTAAAANAATDGMLLKRPLLVTENGVCPGFDQERWEQLLGAE